jgi:hypothetical protein
VPLSGTDDQDGEDGNQPSGNQVTGDPGSNQAGRAEPIDLDADATDLENLEKDKKPEIEAGTNHDKADSSTTKAGVATYPAASSAKPTDLFYGWDSELYNAWRRRHGMRPE